MKNRTIKIWAQISMVLLVTLLVAFGLFVFTR